MFKKAKHLKNQKGLTLVELLAVIVILAIIAAIAVPSIGNIIDNSRYNAVKSDALNVLNAANIYFAENSDKTTVTVADLKDKKYLDTAGKLEGSTGTPATPITVTITKGVGGPNTLSATAINYTGSAKVTFTAATVDMINKDNQKGSDVSGTTDTLTIPKP